MGVDAGLRRYVAIVGKRVGDRVSNEHGLSILTIVHLITTLRVNLLVDQLLMHIHAALFVYQMLLRILFEARSPLVCLSADALRHLHLLVGVLHVVHLVLECDARVPHHGCPVLVFAEWLLSVEAVRIEVMALHPDAVDDIVVHGIRLQVLKRIVVSALVAERVLAIADALLPEFGVRLDGLRSFSEVIL